MSESHPPRLVIPLLAALLLALHAALGLHAVSRQSVAYDEIFHVTGGYFFNRYQDFRIHPENGVLPQRWVALPAVLMGAPPPPLAQNEYWRTSDTGVVSHQFFYETGHDHWPMLMAARAMTLVFSAGTGILIFLWTRTLFGAVSALVVLGWYALDPNVLAHGALATSDAAATFFLLASVSAFWLYLRRPGFGRALLSAAVLGLAGVAKYSAVMLPIMFALLLGWHLLRADSASRRAWLRRAPLALLVHVAVPVFVIWMFYGFRYSAFSPRLPPADHLIVPWEYLLPQIGAQGAVVGFCRDAKLLPEAFLYGYAWVVRSVQARGAFLAGDYSTTGWFSFFPLAFLWKTPLALLAALLLALALAIRAWARGRAQFLNRLDGMVPLAVFLGVYAAFSLTSTLNIGHRHLLPIYPALFILGVGSVAAAGLSGGIGRTVFLGALTLGQAGANAAVAPHYLAFFNALAGGPSNGWRLLVDSSLDWGQDLPALRTWLDAHGGSDEVYLSYFGSGDPAYYHLEARRLSFTNNFKFPTPYVKLGPGVYCISATMLQQVYSPFRGPWTLDREREFQELRRLEPAFASYTADPARQAALEQSAPAGKWQNAIQRYELLRLARLCHYLRARGPDATAGYSILIYRLTAPEIAGATGGSIRDWRALIERAPENVSRPPRPVATRTVNGP